MTVKDELQGLRRTWSSQPAKDHRKCYKCGKVCLTAGKSRAKQVCFSCYLLKVVKLK